MDFTGKFTSSMFSKKTFPIEFANPQKSKICRRLNKKDKMAFFEIHNATKYWNSCSFEFKARDPRESHY